MGSRGLWDNADNCITMFTFSPRHRKVRGGMLICPCREVLRLERFCRKGTKSPNSPIRAGKLPRKRGPAFLRAQTVDFSRLLKFIFAKNFRCTARNRIPSLLTFLGLRIKEPVCEGGQPRSTASFTGRRRNVLPLRALRRELRRCSARIRPLDRKASRRPREERQSWLPCLLRRRRH